MYSIIIKEFEFNTIIGVLDFERNLPQRVIVNCKIDYIYTQTYLDYATISSLIQKIMTAKKFEIIEDSLSYISSYLKNEYPNITKIELEILKPDILDNMIVGAKIEKIYKNLD